MSVVTELTPAVAPKAKRRRPGWSHSRSMLLAGLRALAAGVRAFKDYRLLNGMSAGQLKRISLAHADIPRELHRRHFANMRSADVNTTGSFARPSGGANGIRTGSTISRRNQHAMANS